MVRLLLLLFLGLLITIIFIILTFLLHNRITSFAFFLRLTKFLNFAKPITRVLIPCDDLLKLFIILGNKEFRAVWTYTTKNLENFREKPNMIHRFG